LEALFQESLVFWGELTDDEKAELIISATTQMYKPNSIVNQGQDEKDLGVLIIARGMARVYMSSPEGRQLTLQRITGNGFFVFGISCVLDEPIFNVIFETETECEIVLIPCEVFKRLYKNNDAVKHAIIELLSLRFSFVMSLMERVFFSSVGSRLASALIERSTLSGSDVFSTTHAAIASDIGTVREVVTKLLDKFKAEGLVNLRRGSIEIKNHQALLEMSGSRSYIQKNIN
jgi:CRP/FNR family transcriptional regulator